MKVTFPCPRCGREISRAASLTPALVQCPHCGNSFDAPMMSVNPGTVLGGFRVEKLLGKGGMGQVYLATQLSMDRKVALKILRPDLMGDKTQIKRFLHEVRMLARLEHPNIVTAFEASEEEGLYFLAMSYVDGENLEDRLRREKRIPEAEALSIVLKVARALSYAWNTHRMLHNDIKPANIVIDCRGEVKIMDLGLSKTVLEETGLSMTGVAFGTPNYMSPEQARGKRDLDYRSDQYALGTVLYHMVTGQLPYDAPSILELITKKVREPCASPRELNPDISESCELLICVMMAYDPESRYPTWETLIDDIERVLRGEPSQAKWVEEGVAGVELQPGESGTGAPAPGPTPRAGSRKRRGWKVARRTLALMLALFGIAAWWAASRFLPGRTPAGPPKPGAVLKNPEPTSLSIVRFDAELRRDDWQAVVAEVRNLATSLQDFESSEPAPFRDEGQAQPTLSSAPDPVHVGQRSLVVHGGAVSIRLPAVPLDITGASHIGIWVYDTTGNHPVQLSLEDASGTERSAWSAAYAHKDSWALVTWPIASFAPTDCRRLQSVKLSVTAPGPFYFDDLLVSTESDLKVELKDGSGAVRSSNTVDGDIYADGVYEVWVQTPQELVVGWNYFYYAFLFPTGRGDPWEARVAEDGTDDKPWSKVVE